MANSNGPQTGAGHHRATVQVNGSLSELTIEPDSLSWHKDSSLSPSRANKRSAETKITAVATTTTTKKKKKKQILLANVIAIKKIEANSNSRKKTVQAKMVADYEKNEAKEKEEEEEEEEEDSNESSTSGQPKLKIYYGRSKSTGHRLMKLKKLTIAGVNQTDCKQSIEWIYKQIKQNLSKFESRRPKRLLIFVNPFGGKGKALHLYKTQVRRLLQLAQIETRLIVTRYANHARDTIEDPLFNVDYFDGIICIGGDGMFSELMNGLLFRSNRDELLSMELSATLNKMRMLNGKGQVSTLADDEQNDDHDHHRRHHHHHHQLTCSQQTGDESDDAVELLRSQLGGIGRKFNSPNIPVGVIGAGSTDCNSFGLLGTNDVITATLNIILGNQIQVDVCSIHSIRDDKLLRFVSTFIAYGYFGDVIRESEKFRWLGPKRYDLTGLNTLIRNKSYKGLVRILSSKEDGSPHDLDSRCHLKCPLCLVGDESCLGDNLLRRINSTTGKRTTSNRSLPSRSKSYEVSPITSTTTTTTTTSDQTNNNNNNNNNKLELIEKRGSFVGVNAAVMACRCPQTRKGFSPGNHLANGCADLILVRPCTRMQYINYLMRTAGTKKSAFDLKFVEAYRCRQFEFIAQEEGVESEDGGHYSMSSSSAASTSSSSGRCHGADKKLRSSHSLSSSQQSSNSNSLDTKQSSSSMSTSSGGKQSESIASGASSTTTTTTTATATTSTFVGDQEELGQGSSWNADGEILHQQSIRVKVNNRLLRVFGTGEPHQQICG